MATDSVGYHAVHETYTGTGTQSLLVTDKLDTDTRSVFWNDNDTTKQIIHGSVLSELLTAGTSKGCTWGGHQTFSIDPETDCIGDLYLSITLNLNVPDTPLDTELNPKTLTTLLQKPSSRDAIDDPSKIEPKGWQIRGVAPGDTLPNSGYIGTPNGWLHLKTDANDLGSGYIYSDSGMDGVDNYGLPSEAVTLSDHDPSLSPWGVGPDSAPRAQAWEDIENVLKKDIDLFKVNDFDCAETYLDPSDTQGVIFQRNKNIGLGEFLIQDQGRTASDCYSVHSATYKPADRVRSFNITDTYYHTGIRNKFNDEFTHPESSDQNSFTASSLFNDEKLRGVNINMNGGFSENLYSQEIKMFGATFPDTVDIADLNLNLTSYCAELSNTMNVIASEESMGTWSGNITAAAVNKLNRNWDHILYFSKHMSGANQLHITTQIQNGISEENLTDWNNVASPFGDGRPQVASNIWVPSSSLFFTDELQMTYTVNGQYTPPESFKNDGSIAWVLISADPYSVFTGDIHKPSFVREYAKAMKLYMSQFAMSQPYKNWPGNVIHHTNAPSGKQLHGKIFINDSILEGVNEPTPTPSLTSAGHTSWYNPEMDSERLRSLFDEEFEKKPGGDLVTATIEHLSLYALNDPLNYKIRLDFWKPHTINGRKITAHEMDAYITSTKSILTQINEEVLKSIIDAAYPDAIAAWLPPAPLPLPAPKKSRVFWTITTYSGNGQALLSSLFSRCRPYRQSNRGVGNFIGGGVNNDYLLSENDVLFDITANDLSSETGIDPTWRWSNSTPFDMPAPRGTDPFGDPVITTDPTRLARGLDGRITIDIPNNIYKLTEVLSKGPSWAESFTKLMRLYSVYNGEPEYSGTITFPGASYIGSDNDNTEGARIKTCFDITLGKPILVGGNYSGFTSIGLTTLTRIAGELQQPPPALSTIKNKKGHDNIISPSLISVLDHPTPNPYTFSYLPKYLNHTESEEIKKIGTEYIDLKSNGTYCLYRSTDVLASDLFVSYLSKTDIINLVNHYNNKNSSVYPLTPSRDVPEYNEYPVVDETEICYLQKIEAVEDPPKRPDNLVFYQSDFNGYCTAMSADGNTYAVSQGRMYGDDSEAEANIYTLEDWPFGSPYTPVFRVRRPGLVRVYKKENDKWVLSRIFRAPSSKLNARPKGHVWNVSNGYNQHVDLSGNGNRIVIGDAGGDNNSFTTYDYNVDTKTWAKVGEVQYGAAQTIIPNVTGVRIHVDDGDLPEFYTIGSEFGSCLSLSEDGNRIALTHSGARSTIAPFDAVASEHCVKIYNWNTTLGWQEDSSIPDNPLVVNHPIFVQQELESDFASNELYIGRSAPPTSTGYMIAPGYQFSRGLSIKLSGDGNSYIIGHHHDTTGSSYAVYRLNPPNMTHQWRRWVQKENSVFGEGYSVAMNYDGTHFAVSKIRYDTGISNITIHKQVVDHNIGHGSYYETTEIYGEPNSFTGTSLAFNRDGTRLAIGCPYGIYEKHPIYKNRSRDRQNLIIPRVNNSIIETNLGRVEYFQSEAARAEVAPFPDVLTYLMGSHAWISKIALVGFADGTVVPINELRGLRRGAGRTESWDLNTKYIKRHGGSFYDTPFGAIEGWSEHGSVASLGMRSKRQRSAEGVVLLYERKNESWEKILEMDSSSGERNETDKKSWPGTYGKYGTYKGTADGLGISVSMDGEGNNILAGAPLMSTIGKLQEKIDWYPGGGMTAAYSIHDEGETAKIEDGDPVSSVLLADKSFRSHTRETEEEVGRSYMFTIGKYTHNPTSPQPRKADGARPMQFTDGYNIVNDAQRRLNHDITDFINLPEIGQPIRWDKQFESVPDSAVYPPFRGDYQRPEWADSDLKSKTKFPLLNIIKKIEIIVDEKVWQTINYSDLLAIYSTEMTESSYKIMGDNSSGRLRSDGTRQAKNNGRWIPGKKYNLSIPIPGFTSGVKSGFNNFTQQTECGFLAGLTDSSNFKVKVYYNDLENVWDINNVSAMQGYTAPVYSSPHVTTLIETGRNSSSLISEGARYETTGKSSGNGLYVTNVPEPWTPNITFDTKMYGQKIIMNKDELTDLKNIPDGITKKINTSQSTNNNFLNVFSNQSVSMELDFISLYVSHLIINIEYTNISVTPYLKTAQLFLNSKPFSKLDGGFMSGISNKSLGLYRNEYRPDYILEYSPGDYVFPLANKAFGGSSLSFSNFDTIRLELIFDSSTGLESDQILADIININVTARGLSSIKYKDGVSSLLN
tara:strand:- start:96 stop:6785 length:6690 start_codon:yes stop_codon:yes gene_type:complete